MGSSFYFGIDGGGTRSRIAIVDLSGKIISKAEGYSTSIYSVSKEEVKSNLLQLFALVRNDVSLQSLQGGCIGSAGLARKHEREVFTSIFKEILPNTPVLCCSDGEILLSGGLMAKEGYCLISGTGSLALGRQMDGTVKRAGGLGYMLGDEGSAWWIGHEALVRSLRSIEGRDLHTLMLPELVRACSLQDPDELVNHIHYTAKKSDIASLAPLVTKYADNGDVLAMDILHLAAEELSNLVVSVQIDAITNNELVLAGGVMEHDHIVTDQLKSILGKKLPQVKIVPAKGTALDGACLLARTSF
ncbi:MAG: hypothetical protein K9K80_03200 [Spirochaetia bacterium]|nr:hypothetical protein [Spirochaetia bacterium]